MSEQSIAQARASVMLYNNERKEWEHSGGSSGISRVHVYHHPINNTYRIVGRKVQDHSVVINCALAKGLKYNEAKPTFHQWRDQRQVYGLNFPSREDAQVFGQAVFTALENLRSGGPAAVPQQQQQPIMLQQQQQQQQQQFMPSSHMSNGRGNELDETSPQMRDQPHYDAHDQYSRWRAPSAGPDRSYHNQYDASRDRESPSSSTVSLSTSPGPQPVIQSAPSAPPVPAVPPAPPDPPAPPTPPAAPPAPPGGGPPAPPPPPPAPSAGGGGSLADQIAAAKLKKASKADSEGPRTDRANSASRGSKGIGGGMNMMEEMAKKLAARKAKEEGRDVEPVREEVETRTERTVSGTRSNVSNAPPAPAFGNNNAKTNFLTPAKPTSNGGIRKGSKSDSSPLSHDQLEELKSELLAEFRQELDTAKREIIEALRQEISRVR